MQSATGSGRQTGAPNKITAQAREAIAKFVDGNADWLVGWLDFIAEESPRDAFQCFMSVVAYHIPKLQRSTVAGDPDNPIVHTVHLEVAQEEAMKIMEAARKRVDVP